MLFIINTNITIIFIVNVIIIKSINLLFSWWYLLYLISFRFIIVVCYICWWLVLLLLIGLLIVMGLKMWGVFVWYDATVVIYILVTYYVSNDVTIITNLWSSHITYIITIIIFYILINNIILPYCFNILLDKFTLLLDLIITTIINNPNILPTIHHWP